MSLTQLAAEVDGLMSTAKPEPPSGASAEQRFGYLVEFQRALHGAGLAVPGWPVALGGRGLSPADAAAVAAELGRRGAPEVINFVGIEVLAPALLRFVDQERLRRWLPPMADASEIWCQMFSEPDAGSDLASLRTRADADGDGWRISGSKVWCTWGHHADRGVVIARTGPTASRHRGLSVFVIDMHAAGVEARPLRTMTGEAEFAEVHLDGVRGGPESLVGDVDEGWAVVLHILGSERGPYAIRRAAVLRSALGKLMARLSASGPDALVRQRAARVATTMKLLDLRIGATVDALGDGRVPGPEAALTKRLLTMAEQEIMALANDSLLLDSLAWGEGGAPTEVSEYLYSRAASIYGGSAEIQRNLIGERLLGLPRT